MSKRLWDPNPVDRETEEILQGMSAGDIDALEQEFENLCDLSIESNSQRNSLSDDVLLNMEGDQSTSLKNRPHLGTRNTDKNSTSIGRQRIPSDRIEGPIPEPSRAERRRQYREKRQDSSPIRVKSATNGETKPQEGSNISYRLRRPTHHAEGRKSKENVADDTTTTAESQRNRLTRRRISRNEEDTNTSRPRLTVRRLNSVEEPPTQVTDPKMIARTTRSYSQDMSSSDKSFKPMNEKKDETFKEPTIMTRHTRHQPNEQTSSNRSSRQHNNLTSAKSYTSLQPSTSRFRPTNDRKSPIRKDSSSSQRSTPEKETTKNGAASTSSAARIRRTQREKLSPESDTTSSSAPSSNTRLRSRTPTDRSRRSPISKESSDVKNGERDVTRRTTPKVDVTRRTAASDVTKRASPVTPRNGVRDSPSRTTDTSTDDERLQRNRRNERTRPARRTPTKSSSSTSTSATTESSTTTTTDSGSTSATTDSSSTTATTDSTSTSTSTSTATSKSTTSSDNSSSTRKATATAASANSDSGKENRESSEEERKALITSMRRNLDDIKELRQTRASERKSDSSGDEKRVLRTIRRTDRDVVHPARSKQSESSSDDAPKRRGLRRTPAEKTDNKSPRENLISDTTDSPEPDYDPRPSPQPSEPPRKYYATVEEPPVPRKIQIVQSSAVTQPRKSEEEYISLSAGIVTPPSDSATKATVFKYDEGDSSSTDVLNEMDEAVVLPRRLPRTKVENDQSAAPIQTNFCVDYAAQRRSSLPKTGPVESTNERRSSLRSGESPLRGKAIRRSGSLRTVMDRSWIRDTRSPEKDGTYRNLEIPRRDSLRVEDQSWIRESSGSRESTPSIIHRHGSFTSEEKVVLRRSPGREGRESVERPHSVVEVVDAEISEVRAREGDRAEDDRTRLSMADKLKLFSDTPPSSPQKPASKAVSRRKNRYRAERFKTQPITFEEVEKAGRIIPRPVSLVVTDNESRKLEKAIENRNSCEKELQTGAEIELPKEEELDFFAKSDSKPIKIQVDSDAFDDVFLCSQDMLDVKRRLRPKRKVASKQTGNPIKALRARDDLKDTYTEIKIVDVKKIERGQIDTKTGYAETALRGLASVENFNQVSLKKTPSETVKKSTDPYSSLMLVLIKGRRDVQTRLVEPKTSSLCSGDCYVLITPDRIYCWVGKFGNIMEKAKAQEFANLIVKHKGMGFKGEKDVMVIEEFDSERKKEFWEHLGGLDEYLKTETDDELYEFRICDMNIVYQLEENTLVPDKQWCGQPLKFELLQDHSKVLVFDFGTELYVWNGPKSSFDDRKLGMKLAKQVWDNGVEYIETPNPMLPFTENQGGYKGARPDWAIFGKINHNMETQLFKEKFCDWPEANKIITVKAPEKKDEKEQAELVPCDVSPMLQPNREPVTILLEGTHVGRGRHWVDKKDDFISKAFDVVTIKVTCWLVREYDHHIMEPDSYGQFHDADTYVVRWQYMVMPSVKTLKGGQSRQSLTGRERCAYFFWQGKDSTVNEKGASALMTVELDAERGPQVRVVQGQEPPCFTQLFEGSMIVHLGKRGTKGTSCRLYVVRNEVPHEAYLLEVPCKYSSLRSRSSFILLNTETGQHYLWHGAKSPQTTRDCITQISRNLSQNFPLEIGMQVPIEDPTEVQEGCERRKFFSAFLDVDANSVTLGKDLSFKTSNAPDYKMSPRLFHVTAVSGVFESVEILNASRSEHISPLPFTQEMFYDPCIQPALFLMDIGTKMYVWQGWWPDGFDEGENLQTGSAQARFSKERKLALQTAHNYCTRKEIKGALVIAGHENSDFMALFPSWTVNTEAEVNNQEEYYRLEGEYDIKQLLSRYQQKTNYTYMELVQKPDGIDPGKIEAYLCDEEFELVFRMNKESFYQLPSWKQIALRKAARLF